jgi:rod shape-determining protein MreD
LRVSGFFFFLLLAYVLGVLQSAVLAELLPDFIRPDLMLSLVVYLGIMLPPISGAALVLFCGFIYDCYSGSPFGLFMFGDLAIFFLLKLVGKFLIMGEALVLRLVLLAVAAAAQVLLCILLPYLLSFSANLGFPSVERLVGHVVLTCLAGWPLFYFLRRFDAVTRPEPSGANS